MVGEAVARVIASHHPEYSEANIVLAHTGCRTHVLFDGAGLRKLDPGGPLSKARDRTARLQPFFAMPFLFRQNRSYLNYEKGFYRERQNIVFAYRSGRRTR
jgi:hypothetical protein